MANSVKALGGANKERIKIINGIFLLIILALVIYLIWNHYHNSPSKYSSPPGPASIQTIAKSSDATSDKYLKSGDYNDYQIQQQTMAQQYITNHDSADAVKEMSQVFNNVPQNQISVASYEVMVAAQKAKGDTAAYKHYLQLTITKLNQTGNAALANQFQNVLSGIK